ncbi:MAG: magnesium/cobalt transporter CorA [Clostridiales bacterium]|nr:magnesium/cobalt transporter CorA [Clostridiales bacterium]
MKLKNNITKASIDPPGTLKYTGDYHIKPTLQVLTYNADAYKQYTIHDINELPDNKDVLWLNIIGLEDTELLNDVSNRFKIHKIDLEDIVNVSQRCKIEDKEHYLFSIFKMVYLQQNEIVHEHVSMFMLENILITFQETPGDVFDPIRLRIQGKQGQIRNMGVDYLYYSLIDDLVDQYFGIIQSVSEQFMEVEAAVIEHSSKKMDGVYRLRKELLYLKNSIEPIKYALHDFTRSQPALFTKEVYPYLNDVQDNIYQISDSLNTYREMVNSLYEMQISNASNEMNKVMTTLTVFSAIFIPLSFLTGVFGMNFISIPGLTSRWSFVIFAIFCVLIAGGMLIFFKKKKWF